MCTFRVGGESLDVDAFLAESSLGPCQIFRKGESPFKSGNRVSETSGFNVSVSDAEWDDLAAQMADAINWLRENQEELQRLQSFPGNEGMSLDFPTNVAESNIIIQSFRFPAELCALAGVLGIELEISIWLTDRLEELERERRKRVVKRTAKLKNRPPSPQR